MQRQNSIVIPVSALRRIFVGLLLLILLLVLLLLARQNLWRVGLAGLIGPSIAREIDGSAYQAVFLVGGQVFFGRLQVAGDDYFTLSDVFYLSAGDTQTASQLIKRGTELHGPREPLLIPAHEVLFIENLRGDSQVVDAITKFKAGQLPIASAPPIVTPTAAPTTRPSASPSASR